MDYDRLTHFDWHNVKLLCYVLTAIIFSLIIRLVLSHFSAVHLSYIEDFKYRDGFRAAFCGKIDHSWKKGLRQRSDFGIPFLLGTIELLAYPILLATGAVTVIGAWLGLKTVAQWSTWKEQRYTFNRFLLGNALVIAASYSIFLWYVTVPAADKCPPTHSISSVSSTAN
jgi:hypothetical protein